jgi:ABC-type branched-subunit amino acid transport system substrate-binding protein
MRKVLIALALAAIALVVSIPGAFATTRTETTRSATPGVTNRLITIGGTFPLSGPASLYAPIPRGMQVYFSWVNSRVNKGDHKRGVYGRQIRWKYYDDAYNPAQTVQLTQQLLLQDKVFAIVGSLGTAHNEAIRASLNQQKVPQILVSTGASEWGTRAKEFPWTIGWQPDYFAEGKAYAKWILANAPNAKIAVFSQNDDYGKDYVNGLKEGLGAKRSLIVAEQTYEPTDTSYASQIARLKSSGADTWFIAAIQTPTVRALATAKALAWRPKDIVINSVSAIDLVMNAATASAGAVYTNGDISTGYLKNATSPAYAKDPWVKTYYRIMHRFAPSLDAKNQNYYYGFAKAYDVVRLLYLAGKNPTRQSLMNATRKMNWVNPYALKGMKVKTSATDRFPISQMRLIRYQDGTWTEFGPLINGR